MDFTEVKERVNQLEGAIKRLDSVRKHLSRNASDIKSEIHASVSRNLECLRGREVSLLGAVDQVLALKEDTLQGQQARLNQALGVLHTSLSMAGLADADRQQLADTLHRLNKVELSPEETPYISFRANHLGLREAILSYGRVDANGLPLVTAFEDPSKPSASLPRHLEEYEDVDHHVFYKTLGHSQAGKTPGTKINVTIPKLSTRVEDWLQHKASRACADECFRAARPSSLPQQVRSEPGTASSTPGSSCSLNNWLSLIKQHADLEEEHDFEITDNSVSLLEAPGLSTPGKVSSSQLVPVETDYTAWLHGAARASSRSAGELFKHIPSDPKVWLAQAYSQLRELSVTYGKEKTMDMFAHISKESTVWLQPGTAANNERAPAANTKGLGRKDGSTETSVAPKLNLFSHISTNADDWLNRKGKTSKNEAPITPIEGITNTDDWLMKDEAENQPKLTAVELEDVCRANELCCSISECVSKPDCMAMFLCSESASPALPDSTKDKNKIGMPAFDFQQWASTKMEDWLSPRMTVVAPTKSGLEANLEKLEKLSLDMQVAEKNEGKEAEADSCDVFHMIPGLADPVWQASTNQKGAKEEENLWLRRSPDCLLQDWLTLAKAAGPGEDSEGWSVVSDSFSVHSEQQAVDVATADHFINKWLL
ncbi:hypothetical protein EGW08_000298 [Elysia chlorotica]|uniref:Nuclear receptor coactivator 4 N-terminal domain-containing protein n=1 Tax=Elysia chlorotica TaxID=188477 RepID=A0A3S1BMV5_ELYCH|nr:hypothetical protein EGW08_000298 [Elysia chlorotica]